MDALRFINSNAVREHLKNIKYEFNQVEIAWLIYQCKTLDFEEKKSAWKQLMEEYGDTEIPFKGFNGWTFSFRSYWEIYI